MILGDSKTTLKKFLRWFLVILNDSWISLKLFWGDSQWLLSARTTMWSMPVDLPEWENENDLQNQWKSMRITINTVIFIHLCHLALDHWRGKTLFFMWFSVIVNDSWQFSDDSWISLKLILSDSWWFSVITLKLILWMILGNWFSVILE